MMCALGVKTGEDLSEYSTVRPSQPGCRFYCAAALQKALIVSGWSLTALQLLLAIGHDAITP